jgi:hypothetical protein
MQETIKILKKTFGKGSQAFDYPLKSHENKNYYRSLEVKLQLFRDKINELPRNTQLFDEIRSNLKKVDYVNKNLLKIVDKYLWGNQKVTNDYFGKLINTPFVKDILLSLSELVDTNKIDPSRLYRIRQSEVDLVKRKQIFHIPFNDRHLVANQRYSIAGLPCLYLGSSIYVCWLELGKPKFSNIFISGYKSTNSLKILNLSYNLEIIIKELEEKKITTQVFLEKFLLWPLVMACSFQVKYPKAPFHEEYIIPGLLLEWITFEGKEIKGLKYLSTKLNTIKKSNYAVNYVFPPQDKHDNFEFCPILSKEFKLTNPLSWDLLTILPPADVVAHGSGIKAENLEDALLNNYEYSRFGFVEEQVFSMEFDYVNKQTN